MLGPALLCATFLLASSSCKDKSGTDVVDIEPAIRETATTIEFTCGDEQPRALSITTARDIDATLCATEWTALGAKAAGRMELLNPAPKRRFVLRRGSTGPMLEVHEPGQAVRRIGGLTELRLSAPTVEAAAVPPIKLRVNGRMELLAADKLGELLKGRRKRDVCAIAEDLGSKGDTFEAYGDEGVTLIFQRADCDKGSWYLKQGKQGFVRLRGWDDAKLIQQLERLSL